MIIVSESYRTRLHLFTDSLVHKDTIHLPLKHWAIQGNPEKPERSVCAMSVVPLEDGYIVCGLYEIMELDLWWKPRKRLTLAWMNDIHYVEPSGGNLLVVNTGFDEVTEIGWDGEKVAGGFYWNCDIGGFGPVAAERREENRGWIHDTAADHQVHVNYAHRLDKDRWVLSLFKLKRTDTAGAVVIVNKKGERLQQFVSAHMHNIHSPVQLPKGDWLVASSGRNKIIRLNSTGQVRTVYENIVWPKCILPLDSRGGFLTADLKERQLVRVDYRGRQYRVRINFQPYWIAKR